MNMAIINVGLRREIDSLGTCQVRYFTFMFINQRMLMFTLFIESLPCIKNVFLLSNKQFLVLVLSPTRYVFHCAKNDSVQTQST